MLAFALLALSAGPPAEADDSHDLLILHPSRVFRVRLHLRVDGQPFLAPWARQVGRLFRHLDADGDGLISPREAALAPGREQWLQMSAGDPTIDPEPAPPLAALARGKKSATLADVAAFYAGGAAGPLRAGGVVAQPPHTSRRPASRNAERSTDSGSCAFKAQSSFRRLDTLHREPLRDEKDFSGSS